MTYSIMRMIEMMGDEFPLLLNAVLSRFPIIVAGRDIELVDDITNIITMICSDLNKIMFWRDFKSE